MNGTNNSLTSTLLICIPFCACMGKPNIIYIVADDLGYGDIGCYGQQKIKTPNIDRLATEGMLFTQHYAGCPVSAPSRCSLMTGLHTGHTQIRGNKEIMPEGQQPMQADTYTISKLMKSAGYNTGLFGKWGLGTPESESTPTTMGFDEFFGYNCQRKAHSYYPEYLWKNGNKVLLPENENVGRKVYSQELIHTEALKFIRDNIGKPFFAMLTYTLPHAELNLPHDSLYRMYENSFPETPFERQGSYYASEKPKASFAAMVSLLDRYVGELMAEIQRAGIENNTIIVFTSDNGPHREGGADPDFFQSYGPLRGTKRSVHEGGIRVPMIIRFPGKVQAGTSSDHVSAFWDVMPTLAEISGVELPVQTDGISFLPTLLSESDRQQQHDYLYWEFHEEGGKIAVRKENWKLVLLNVTNSTQKSIHLYNIANDIHEDHDLASQYPDVVAEMMAIAASSRVDSEVFPFLIAP